MKRKSLLIIIIIASLCSCKSNYNNTSSKNSDIPKKESKFKIAFMTDIHLNNKNNNCFFWFEKSMKDIKSHGADFIITGGDNVDIDGLKEYQVADQLYEKIAQSVKDSDIPLYATIGNHDRFWAIDEQNPLYNEGLFENHLNKAYYSFNHKGWHFIILNSSNYIIDEKQKLWLQNDLDMVDSNTPIIVSTHVPFLSVYYPTLHGSYTSKDTFSNFKEIWDMFNNKNLKLVLQGHMHLYEEIKIKDVQFITAGALSGNWWNGAYHGTEPGYLLLDIYDNNFEWEYVNIGWESK